jgi:hypothetical protein
MSRNRKLSRIIATYDQLVAGMARRRGGLSSIVVFRLACQPFVISCLSSGWGVVGADFPAFSRDYSAPLGSLAQY